MFGFEGVTDCSNVTHALAMIHASGTFDRTFPRCPATMQAVVAVAVRHPTRLRDPLEMPTPAEARRPRRPLLPAIAAVLLGFAVQSCGLDKLTSNESAASAVTFRLAGDSVLTAGVSRPYDLSATGGTVDYGRTTVEFRSSDSTVARVDSVRAQRVWVTGRRIGAGVVRVTVRAPELPAGRTDSVRVRVRFGGIRFDAIDTINGLGAVNGANQRAVVVRGTLPSGSPAPGTPAVAATVVSRDTLRLRVAGSGTSVTATARDTGAVWLVATLDGATDSVRVPIRRRITRVVADSLQFGALLSSRSVPVRVLDAGDSAIVGAAFRFTGLDTLRLQVDSTGPGASATSPRLRARVRDTASYVVVAGPVTSPRARTRVSQVPASLVVTAGAGQRARYGTAVAVAPRIVVRDSGLQGIGGVTVTFSVPNAGNGTVTGPAAQVTNAAGEATVPGWTLGGTSGVDTLLATVAGLPAATITAEALAGAPVRVRFVAQPQGGGQKEAVAPPPQVAVQDSAGNVVAAATDSITIAPVGTAGGSFTGRTTVAAVAGLARFDSLFFTDTTSVARLVASAGKLGVDTSAAFPIGRPAAQIAFLNNPGAVAGGSLMAPVTLELRDASGARASGAADSVIITMSNTLASLTGTVRRQAVAGRVTFDDLRVQLGGGQSFQLVATTPSGLSVTSSAFAVAVGPASQLRFVTLPVPVAPGTGQSVQVVVTDSGGNVTPANGTPITLRLGANPGSATLSDSSRTANNGNAFFFPSVSAAGAGYTLVASSPGLASATSRPFNVRPAGPPTRIRWVQRGSAGATAGFALSFPQLEILDSAGVRATATRLPYTLTIASGPAGAVVTNPTDSVFSNGINSASARLRQVGTYRLIVTAGALPPDTSGPVTVYPGNGTRLSVLSQPAAAGVGAPVGAVQVALTDSLGNIAEWLPSGTNVANSLSISAGAVTGTGSAVTPTGTLTRTTTNSVATFDNLAIGAAGAGYRLTFTSGVVANGAQSDTFSVRTPGTPRQLRVTGLPARVNGGSPIPLRVSIVDSVGTTVPTRTDSITLTLRGPSGAVFRGSPGAATVRVAAVGGIANFPTLAIPRADSGLRIVASSNVAGILPDSTPLFRASVGPASRLTVLQAPTQAISGAPLSPAPRVAVADSGGNVVTTAVDTLVIAPTSYSYGGRSSAPTVAGIAQFDSLIVWAGAGNQFRLTTGAFRSFPIRDTSAVITSVVGPAARVQFTSAPGGSQIAVGAFSISGRIVDVGGNLVTTGALPVTVSVVGPGAVSGPTSLTSSSGVFSGSGLSLPVPGTYRWVIASPGLRPDTSPAFRIIGLGTRVRVLSAPAVGVRNGVLGPITAVVTDSLGQVLPRGDVVMTATPVGGAALSGGRTRVTAASGDTARAVFNDLASGATGPTRIVISAEPNYLVGAAVRPDTVTIAIAPYAAAAALRFTTQPASLVTGQLMPANPVVAVIDSVGNTVTDSVARTIAVSLQQGTQPGSTSPTSGFLTGALSVSPAPGSGTATFTGLSVNSPGNGYALLATANGVNASVSQPFNVVQTNDAIALRFLGTTVPSSAVAGTTLAGSGGTLAVEVINSTGARVTSSAAPITLSVRGDRAAVAGTATVTAVNGVATFSAASLQRADTGYVLLATAPGLIGGTAPTPLTIAHAAATGLVFLDSLPTVAAGSAWPSFRVAVTDGFGNVATSAPATTVAIGRPGTSTNTSGDSSYVTWFGPTNGIRGAGSDTAAYVVTTVGGVATFASIRPRFAVDRSQANAFLLATTSGLASARSARFTIVPAEQGALRAVTYYNWKGGTNPYSYVVGEAISVSSYIADSLYNVINSGGGVSGASVTWRPSVAGVTVSGDSTGTFNGGFATRVVRLAGPASVLRLTPIITGTSRPVIVDTTSYSPALTLSPFGPAAQLRFLTGPPASTARNVAMSPAVRVAVTDTVGNVVTNLTTGTGGLTGTITLDVPNISTVGGTGAALSGSGPVTLVNGLATFPSVSLNTAGVGYLLRARVTTGTAVTGVTGAVQSAAFTISP